MLLPPLGYLVFMLPAVVLAGLASFYTKTTFNRYARYRAQSGITGAEAARRMLQSQGINNVTVERVGGFLSDHYNPLSRALRLSQNVYGSSSLSAIGVACHEAGHALQHARRYAPLMLRSALVPATQIGSKAAYALILLGFLLGLTPLLKLGAILFGVAVAFAIVTLPVEWDASARAKRLMTQVGIVSHQEEAMAGKVLNAAFLTYVAAAVSALMTLIYYLMRAGLLGRRND